MTYNRSLEVTATQRPGWAWQAVVPVKQTWPFTMPSGNYSLNPANPPNGIYPVAGAAGLDLAYSGDVASAVSDEGPNHQLKYFSQPISTSNGTVSTAFYWVLSPDIESPASEFYSRQCGDYNPATGTGFFISGGNLLANTIRHESGSVQSHHRNYVQAQDSAENNPGVYTEGVIGSQATTIPDFKVMVDSSINERLETIATLMFNEPYAVTRDENNQYLGAINYAPTYATCP